MIHQNQFTNNKIFMINHIKKALKRDFSATETFTFFFEKSNYIILQK